MPDGSILILDEDELLQALNENSITKDDYALAYQELAELRKEVLSLAYMGNLCSSLLKMF